MKLRSIMAGLAGLAGLAGTARAGGDMAMSADAIVVATQNMDSGSALTGAVVILFIAAAIALNGGGGGGGGGGPM